jgi:hypothetical protein
MFNHSAWLKMRFHTILLRSNASCVVLLTLVLMMSVHLIDPFNALLLRTRRKGSIIRLHSISCILVNSYSAQLQDPLQAAAYTYQLSYVPLSGCTVLSGTYDWAVFAYL